MLNNKLIDDLRATLAASPDSSSPLVTQSNGVTLYRFRSDISRRNNFKV